MVSLALNVGAFLFLAWVTIIALLLILQIILYPIVWALEASNKTGFPPPKDITEHFWRDPRSAYSRLNRPAAGSTSFSPIWKKIIIAEIIVFLIIGICKEIFWS